MTTVVVTRDAMYSDSKCGGDIPFRTQKLFRIGDSILGTTGDLYACLKFLKWFEEKGEVELSGDDDWEVAELNAAGIWLWDKNAVPIPVLEDYYALGSGGKHAITGLDCGKTPEEAIELACRRDEGSALPVVSMRLVP